MPADECDEGPWPPICCTPDLQFVVVGDGVAAIAKRRDHRAAVAGPITMLASTTIQSLPWLGHEQQHVAIAVTPLERGW